MNENRVIGIGKSSFSYVDYQEHGIQGVGKKHTPIVNMDPYINHDMDDELHIEACKGLALAKSFDAGRFNGSIPPEVAIQYGSNVYTVLLSQLKHCDATGRHRKAMEEIDASFTDREAANKAIYRYAYFALGAIIPWYFVLTLKHSIFEEKDRSNDNFTEDSQYFPKLLSYIDTLPFKHVGRIIIFTTYPNAGVVTHRDGPVSKHKDHSINLFFSDSRPTFIYDEIKKEKVYLEKGAKSYFFNNRDYHGVDPEPVFRYTVRVDGTFNDDMIDILQLENGYV